MVLTKKKSFNLNNTSINRSRKINSFSQEGGDRTLEQKDLEKKVKKDQKYKKKNRLNLFIGFNEYYKINEENSVDFKNTLSLNEMYIHRNIKKNQYSLDTYDKSLIIKNFNSLQELSKSLNTVTKPNILNVQLSLRQGGLPVCLVNQYRIYQMTTNDVQEMFLKKISRYLTDSRKKNTKGGFVNTFNVMTGGAESEESPLVRALNNLLSIKELNDIQKARVERLVDKLIEKMFSEIDKSYPEGNEGEEGVLLRRNTDLENEIKKFFTKYLDDFLTTVDNLQNNTVKQHLKEEFSRDTLTKKLKERAGFQDKTPTEIQDEALKNASKENEKFHSEFLYQEGWEANKKYLFGDFYSISYNTIHFYVRKAFGYTESEIEERHQSYMVLVIYESNLFNLIKKVIETFEFLRDSIYDEIPEDSTTKSKESVFYDIITKNFIRLRKRNYGDITTGYKDKKNDVPVSAIEFYSASRNIPVSSIIEFIKMLIEYTRSENGYLKYKDIKYQLINKKEEDAKKVDA